MAKKQEQNKDAIFDASLSSISARILSLETSSQDLFSGANSRDEHWRAMISSLKQDIALIKAEIASINLAVERYDKSLSVLSSRFKLIADKEDLDSIKKRIAEWPLELFVQRE